MGMFDTVVCEWPLPDEAAKDVREWQTKDFEHPYLDIYRISAEGRLEEEVAHYEACEPPTDTPEVLRELWSRTKVRYGWKDLHHHGVLNFYGFPDDGPHRNEWVEYNAKFTDGQLVSVERVMNPDAAPSPEQKQ